MCYAIALIPTSRPLRAHLIQCDTDRLRASLRFDAGLAGGGAKHAHARAVVHAKHLDAVQVGVGHVPVSVEGRVRREREKRKKDLVS